MIFSAKKTLVSLIIDGDEKADFDKGQYLAYTSFIDNSNILYQEILQAILDYYKKKRYELGYDTKFNNNYPLIETTDTLLEYITITVIVIPYDDLLDGRDIRVTFDCSWDIENGIGVRVLNEKVTKVGYQDIAR